MTSELTNPLQRLQAWYQAQCNGEWEHGHGIEIDTLDNPGWSMCVNLASTPLENRSFEEMQIEYSTEAWMHCRVVDKKFKGYGGPQMLDRIIGVFLDWAARER
jgi:hypothetical protein